MEHFRAALERELLFRLIPPIILIILAVIGIVILFKFIGAGELKYARTLTAAATIIVVLICGLILFFDTKDLFSDLNNNNFVEYYGEATYDEKRSNKEFNVYRLKDNEKTVVDSNVGKVDATIDKCIVYVVYGGDSKYVVVFDVKEVLEER